MHYYSELINYLKDYGYNNIDILNFAKQINASYKDFVNQLIKLKIPFFLEYPDFNILEKDVYMSRFLNSKILNGKITSFNDIAKEMIEASKKYSFSFNNMTEIEEIYKILNIPIKKVTRDPYTNEIINIEIENGIDNNTVKENPEEKEDKKLEVHKNLLVKERNRYLNISEFLNIVNNFTLKEKFKFPFINFNGSFKNILDTLEIDLFELSFFVNKFCLSYLYDNNGKPISSDTETIDKVRNFVITNCDSDPEFVKLTI